MKKSFMPVKKFIFFITLIIATIPATAQHLETNVQIDAGKKYQSLDGFGVNINAAWWLDGEYRDADVVRPAIDMLIDSLGATIFRVVSRRNGLGIGQ